ncbi:ABC transporter substrate-binding protein [Protaetiibacter intestinalis]|uniref:ABC transporter substrate-binding protein n=1 Tax=Protaetiibacter intestinalis TaxID=2419774 RepID=A0A387B7E9_9MICO|nr:ABC transporter substrate-binding protein [Protaetiibacter intestinalis]AYF98273.1 ABC transporter substrate-binding protein [Protaetiibacter intestinalis]
MTQPHARATTVSAIALAVAGALVLSSCSTPGSEAQPGLTDDSVKVGTHQPLTGPAAASYAPISAATAAYFDYVNANGGINGRTIEYIVKDDGYNPATTQTVVRELVLEDEVFAILGGLGTPTHSSVLDFLNENEVPDLFVSSGSAAWNQVEKYPFTFGFQTDYVTEGMVLGQYISEEFADEKVCLFGQDDEFGTDVRAGLELILGADGLAEVQSYSVSNQDVAAQIVALQSAGCEVNVLATITGFTALAIGTAAQLKYFPQWVSSSSGADYGPLAGYLGDAAPLLLEGFISDNYLPSATESENNWIELFREVNDEYNDGAEFTGSVVYGMAMGYLFAEALLHAGKHPTREGLVSAVQSGDLKGSGLVPLAFGVDNHSGYVGAGITVVHDGIQGAIEGKRWVREGDTVVPWDNPPVELLSGGIPS